MNPYKALPDNSFWYRAVTYPQHGQIDPVTKSQIIQKNEKVATMGSCFAQHLARHIQGSGLNYFVPETAPSSMSLQDAVANNYGTFSARYGNIYTVRQALQLFDRAFGEFVPKDAVWRAGDFYVDAFRPRIDLEPKRSDGEVLACQDEHLSFVRRVFVEADWIVFTLGLTEAWRSKVDGAVYPLAPGVAAGAFDDSKYEFVNFTVREVSDDLNLLFCKIQSVNQKIKFLLTVSPVPLIATYEGRHVLSSTVFSKSVLRVAADELERKYKNIIYFPSYEIITSPAAGNRYFEDDLREVNRTGVNHVMRVFGRHFIHSDPVSLEGIVPRDTVSAATNSSVVCDEEAIQESLARAGFRRGNIT